MGTKSLLSKPLQYQNPLAQNLCMVQNPFSRNPYNLKIPSLKIQFVKIQKKIILPLYIALWKVWNCIIARAKVKKFEKLRSKKV